MLQPLQYSRILPFVTETPGIAVASARNIHNVQRQSHVRTPYKQDPEALRKKLQRLTSLDGREFPVSPLHMNTAQLTGLDNLLTAFDSKFFVDILKHGIFFSSLAGQNLGSIAMQMGTIMYDEPGAFDILKDIYKGFVEETFFHPKGIVAGGYHALLHKIENPALLLEYRSDERVDISTYKNIFDYLPNEFGGVVFDYFDPESNTGHEVKYMQNFCAPDKVSYHERIEFDRIRQIHKYCEWLNQDESRKLEYHLMVNIHIDFLRILKDHTPKHLQHRVKINLYSSLNFHTPVRTVFLSESSPLQLWEHYYNLDLKVRADGPVRELKSRIIDEINLTKECIKHNLSWNYFGNNEVTDALKLLQATFAQCLPGVLAVDFDKLMDAIISQWNDMHHENLAPENLVFLNSYLVKLLECVEITLVRRNATALFHLVDFARNLAFETRPYHHALEEYGIFYPLNSQFLANSSHSPTSNHESP